MSARVATTAGAVIAAVLFGCLAVVTLHGDLSGFDETVRNHVHALSTPWLTLSAQLLTWLGASSVLALFSALGAAFQIRAGRPVNAKLLLSVMVGAIILENALKFAVQRPRPPPFFGTDPTTFSFPSGHALFSLCFYGVVAVILGRTGARALAWSVAVVIVVVVGTTRIYLGVHYPTDVIAGYLVGTAWLCTVLAVEADDTSTGRGGTTRIHPPSTETSTPPNVSSAWSQAEST